MSTTTFVNQAIDFDEWDGSPTRQHQGGVSVITVIGTTSWSDVDNFITFLFPVGQNIGGLFGARLAANTLFRVFDYSVEGFGGLLPTGVNGLNTYELAKWTIKFHVPTGQNLELTQPYNSDPVPGLVHRVASGGQFLTIARQALLWQSDSKPPLQQVLGALFIPTSEHAITWPNLLNPPFAAMRACMGKINTAPLTISTGTINTGQGLFVGWDCETTIFPNGNIARNITYKISERNLQDSLGNNLDWNFYHRDDAGNAGYVSGQNTREWDRLMNVKTGAFTYNSANFNSLFPNTF